MGSPQVASEYLQILLGNNLNVVGVYTQPPRPKGRGMNIQNSPVHNEALKKKIPVFHPENFKDNENTVTIGGISTNVGIKAGMVPGNLAGWFELHNKYGSIDLKMLIEPAINYAENGFPVSKFAHETIKLSVPILSKYPSSNIFLGNAGKIPNIGSIIKLPQLAQSLKAILKGGKDVF